MSAHLNLHPRLVVSDPDAALSFYQSVFDAKLVEWFTDAKDRVVHAAIAIDGTVLSLAQCVPEWGLLDPLSLGGSPCLLHASVDEPDRIAESFATHGGRIIIEVADRPYGKREGRVADPSGHLWILSKTIEVLDEEEISRRLKSL